ncbi:nucleotidyltransferase [Azospirillum formosense]|uniref:Nucleotidyltransferase n=1 Tax=Azospirillum formosense TaxID=861533 RepID=A0ABX2KQ80_9PROT|nr:nucleotidyltransferase family protein [Azospirillum formosense]NUB17778.1 nucleotidyltransferase [Azospirillum formosense]
MPAGVSAEDIKALASRFVAGNLRVFGSRATGRARPGSDLDLLVELEPGRDLFDLIELKHALEERTAAAVDVVTERGLSPYMRDGILQSARSL